MKNHFSHSHIIFVLTIVIFACSNANSSINEYQYVGDPIATVFSIEEHQSGNQIWRINQYIDGRMLFATANGLSIWNGETWQQTSTPNNTRIRDITIWHDANIYAGAVGELGYFSPTDTGKFRFTVIPTEHLIDDFGQTRGINSNKEIVVYSTDQAVLVWDGKQINKINQFNAKGSRVFKINEWLLVEDGQQLYSIELVNNEPLAKPLKWKFPADMQIKSVFLNQQNQVVMVTNMQGVYKLENDTFINVISPDMLPENHLNGGIQGQDGFYYLNSTIDGLVIFNESFELLRHYKPNDGLGLSTIYNIFQDQQQNIWLAGLPNISVFQPPHLRSHYSSNTGTLDFENIYNFGDDLFFSGTGFYQLTFPKGKNRSPIFTQTPDFNLVVLDMLAFKDELFVGTEAGVYLFKRTKVGTETLISDPTLISTSDWVSELVFSPDHTTFYATIGNHLSQFQKIKGRWQETPLIEDKSGTEYLAIQPIDQQQYNIWFTTEQQELYRLKSINGVIEKESSLKFDKQSAPLGNDHLRPFFYEQRMFIGTQNGAIEYQENSKHEFKLADDFAVSLRTPSKDIFRIEVDKKQRVWYHAGSDTGVMYKDSSGTYIEQEALFKPYNTSGTRGLAYFDNAIWFGVANGNIYRMSEQSIYNLPQMAPLSIQYVNSINRNARLSLDPNKGPFSIEDKSIRIGYALYDYSSPSKTQYRTLFTGPEELHWTPWSSETSKDFTMLSGGNYTLKVEALDVWGRTSATQYHFAIEFPWFASIWAKLLYLMLLLIVIAMSIKLGQRLRNKGLEQQNITLELGIQQRTKEIKHKVDELKEQQILKDRFFSNVSHEFRTPLTLTIGPLETILKECISNIDTKTKNLTVTALNNARTMLALVGQVLDINRLELGKLSLRVASHDIAGLLRANHQRFLPWAQQNQQQLIIINCENPYEVYCDVDQIDKCVSNLLSNAIKYSGKETTIRIELIHQPQTLGIKITDNGYGIPSMHKDQVFDRYYQEESSQSKSTPGTGIGLALVKELIELHHGSINLETEIDQGCEFTLWLHLGKSHFTLSELIEPIVIQDANLNDELFNDSLEKDLVKILVVDDNVELRQFICQRLAFNFTVLEAENGHAGFESAIKDLPDIIISDITMPVMSGLELTQKLKAHPETKHIPILLLSAQTSKRDIVDGFACGADDFVIKPFDTSELVMRIKTLIDSRKNFARQKIQLFSELPLSKNGDHFEQSIQKFIFTHLHQSDFNIDSLSQLMFMSKETMRRKCNISFGMSPSAYIQERRLQQAKILLEQKNMNVSEVAYAVGFDSLAYFSKSFKKYYNVSPSALTQV